MKINIINFAIIILILNSSFSFQERAYKNYYTSVQLWEPPFIHKVPIDKLNWSENKFTWQEGSDYFWLKPGKLVNGEKLMYKKLKVLKTEIFDGFIKTSYRCMKRNPTTLYTSFVKWEYKDSNKFIIEIYDQIPNSDDILISSHSNFIPK